MEQWVLLLPVTMKKSLPIKISTVITMRGQVVIKRVFDGETGYQMQMGQKVDMDEDEITDKKTPKGYFRNCIMQKVDIKLK